MSDDFGEAFGTAAEGALMAKAVEGQKATPLDHGHFAEDACLNCGTGLIGSHCHHCGQRAHVHRTLGAFAHDLLHGVLHVEGKTWRTARDLTWRPGKMTRDYIDGKRQTYVSPIALFLFVVFLSFATFQLLGGASALSGDIEVDEGSVEQVAREYDSVVEQLSEREAALAEARDAGDAAQIATLESDIADLEVERSALTGAIRMIDSDALPGEADEGASPVDGIGKSVLEKAADNPQLLAYKMQTNAYKFAWLLIPISVPFVWLLFFWKRRFKLYDHTVFTTYSITFMLALAGLSGVLIYLGTAHAIQGLQGAGLLLSLYAPFHMYRHVRGTYDTSRLSAVARMLALSVFAWVGVGLFVTAVASLA